MYRNRNGNKHVLMTFALCVLVFDWNLDACQTGRYANASTEWNLLLKVAFEGAKSAP